MAAETQEQAPDSITQLIEELEKLQSHDYICGLVSAYENDIKITDEQAKDIGLQLEDTPKLTYALIQNGDTSGNVSLDYLIGALKKYQATGDKGVWQVYLAPDKKGGDCDMEIGLVVGAEKEKMELHTGFRVIFKPGEKCLPAHKADDLSKIPCVEACTKLNELYNRLLYGKHYEPKT